MKTLVLDTNTLLRFLLHDVASQSKQVEELFLKAKDKKVKLFVPQIVLFEVQFALSKYYKFPKKNIVENLQRFIMAPYIDVEDKEIFHKALELFNEKNIDFVDCFLVGLTQLTKTELFTFDKDLRKLTS